MGDINVNDRTIQFKEKNSPLKTKIIPEILWGELPDLTKLNKEWVLFTPQEFGGVWETREENRRDYFSKSFKNGLKDHFGLYDPFIESEDELFKEVDSDTLEIRKRNWYD